MYLTEGVQQLLCEEARESAPRETCGFVLTDGQVIPMENVNQGDGEWAMNKKDAIATRIKNMGRIKGTYHSHPRGLIQPSRQDMEHCPPSYTMWIVTQTEVWRWFRYDQSWIGVYEPTFGAAVVSRGADGFRPASTSVAVFGRGRRELSFVSVERIDEVGGHSQSLADYIRQEADA